MSCYAGWRFISSSAFATRAIKIWAGIVNYLNDFFLPGALQRLMHRLVAVSIKISAAAALGVVLAPIQIAKNAYKIYKARTAREIPTTSAA